MVMVGPRSQSEGLPGKVKRSTGVRLTGTHRLAAVGACVTRARRGPPLRASRTIRKGRAGIPLIVDASAGCDAPCVTRGTRAGFADIPADGAVAQV